MSNHRARLALALSTLVGVSSLARGESFSLEQVEALARERAPAIAVASARIAAAEGIKRRDVRPPDLELTAGGARARPDGGGSSGSEWLVEVGAEFPAPWGAAARGKVGDAAVRAASADAAAVALDVVSEARRLYVEAVVAEDLAQSLEESARDAGTLRELIARRVEIGEAAEADRLRTQVETRRAELDARSAVADREGARAALDAFVLGALGPDFVLTSRLEVRELSPTPVRAIESNPDLLAAKARAESAASRVTAERRARFPGLRVAVFRDSEIDKTSTGGALTFGIPLWNRNEGSVRVAQAEQLEADAEVRRIESLLRAATSRLVAKDGALRDGAVAYTDEILPAARETLAISTLALEQGEASLLPWLEARRSYLEILRASLEARRDAFLTRAELDRLLGAPHATPSR